MSFAAWLSQLTLPSAQPVALAATCIGFALGMLAVPPFVNALLFWKYECLQQTWHDALTAFKERGLKLFYTEQQRAENEQAYEEDGKVVLLEPSDKEGRELYSWAQRQVRAAKAAALDAEQVKELIEAQVIDPAEAQGLLRDAPDQTALSGRYCFHPGLFARAACGLFLAAGFALAASFSSPTAAASAAAAVSLMECIALTDLRVKLIPIELTCGFALAAAVFAASVSLPELAQSAAAALCVLGVLLVANSISRMAGGRTGVGMGDIRLAPFIALLSGATGTVYGFAAASVLALALALFILAAKKGNRASTVPYAPGLALWCYVGLLMRSPLCM